MKLDAWLRQNRPMDERLRVIERLCQAVNEIHDRGDAVGGLEPGRIDLGDDGVCDLSGARKRSSRAPYAAPEGARANPALADIYAAGAIAWEILAGRSVGASRPHLAEVRPDIPRELADAVMACLEQSPDWRPNDLTYLAQIAAARQKATGGRPSRADARAPLPPRSAPTPARRRGPRRRTWPLLAALVVVIGLGYVAGRQYLGDIVGLLSGVTALLPGTESSPAATPSPGATPRPAPATPPPAAPPAVAPDAAPPSRPVDEGAEPDVSQEITEAPPPSALPPAVPEVGSGAAGPEEPAAPPEDTATAVATPVPAAVPTAEVPPEPPSAVPPRAPATTTTETAATPAAPVPVEPPAPAVAGPPAVLSAVAPPTVKRPGKVLVDLRGTGLGPHHQARILPVKKVPWGIRVLRQKHVNETLITILLELEETAEPGEYAIAVEDEQGTRSEPLTFEVTK